VTAPVPFVETHLRYHTTHRSSLTPLLIVVVLMGWICVRATYAEQTGIETPRPSSAVSSELSSLASRIAALTPRQPVSGGARFVPVTLLGYDLGAPCDQRGVPHVIAGRTYGFVLYLEIKEPGDLRFDMVVKLGELYVSRQRISIAKAQPGAVVKEEIAVRIPITAPVGEARTSFSVLDTGTPTLAEGGTLVIDHERTPLTTSRRNPQCRCWVRDNMIPNASFEDNPRDPNWIPAEWRTLFGYSQVIDNCDAHCGTHSLMVDFHGGIDVSAWLVRGIELHVTPDKNYKFGFWYKTRDLPKGGVYPVYLLTSYVWNSSSCGCGVPGGLGRQSGPRVA